MERFRIGYDVTILWSVTDKKGVALPLTDKEVHLYYTCERGRFEADIEIQDDNVVVWHFLNEEQRVLGSYGLTLEVLQSDGKRAIRKDICEAFTLVGKSCFEETEGEANVLEGGEIVLSSELDIYRISPIVPTIGLNGNWWIDGKDSGYLASTARDNVREIFLPTIDEDGNITRELTPEQKAYNAETYAMLERGESPLLHIQQWIVYRVIAGYDFYCTVEILGGAMKGFMEFSIEPTGDISGISGVIYSSVYNFQYPESVVQFVDLLNSASVDLGINEITIVPYGDTEAFSKADRFYFEGETLAIEFNKGDKRYKQTFNKETGELIEETDITPAGFSRLLFVPEVDEDYNIIGELTPKEKEYNAETARRLRNGEPITLSVCHMGEVLDCPGYTSVNADDISCYFWTSAKDGNEHITVTLQNDGTISYINSVIYYGTYPFFDPSGVISWRNDFPYSLYWGRIQDNYGGSYITANAVSLGSLSDIECIIADYTFEGKNIRRYYNILTGEMIHEEVLSSGGVDPELLEGLMPMSRDFSDDFNNDFAR